MATLTVPICMEVSVPVAIFAKAKVEELALVERRLVAKLDQLAVDDLPQEVSSALLSARLNGIRKSNGGCRVLGCGGVIRRMVFKQVARELQCTLRQWCSDRHFGLHRDGCGRMFRYIEYRYIMGDPA